MGPKDILPTLFMIFTWWINCLRHAVKVNFWCWDHNIPNACVLNYSSSNHAPAEEVGPTTHFCVLCWKVLSTVHESSMSKRETRLFVIYMLAHFFNRIQNWLSTKKLDQLNLRSFVMSFHRIYSRKRKEEFINFTLKGPQIRGLATYIKYVNESNKI